MVTSIRRRIPRLIGASGLAATLALGAGAATATAALQEVSKAKATPTALCSTQKPCIGGNQNNQASGNPGVNPNNPASGLRQDLPVIPCPPHGCVQQQPQVGTTGGGKNNPNKLLPGLHGAPVVQAPGCTRQTCNGLINLNKGGNKPQVAGPATSRIHQTVPACGQQCQGAAVRLGQSQF
ncbi:hypothetical protein [Streptomyces sp. NPDC058247]|uniref:hypothetical protein n=1 Tax=Streptomyces sp. NPDC058247 TaxID=3346401 RepID=UPI0036E5AC39